MAKNSGSLSILPTVGERRRAITALARSRVLFFVMGLVLVGPYHVSVWAEEQSVRPGINHRYMNPRYLEWVAIFERPGREVFDRRHEIVTATGVRPGMVVADIGAGTGLFTRLFAPAVGPTGRVIAVDISRTFISNVLQTSRAQGLNNVTGIVNSPKDVGLPAESIDLAFICDTYHHFEYPQSTMRSIHRALRPDGRLVVIDFRRIPGVSSGWVMHHVRAGKETTKREIEAAGFRLIEEKDLLRYNYFLVFEKI